MRGRWRELAVLLVVCGVALLPGLFALPPQDADESRFAQASKQMVQSGDYAVPRLQGEARLNKPPMIYWLQAASARVGGVVEAPVGAPPSGTPRGGIGWYRVPSVVCAAVAAVLTWWIGLSMFPQRNAVKGVTVALLAGALLVSALMVLWDARQARADQLLLATTTLSMGALWRVWRSERPSWWWAVVLWVGIGLGVMAKGPITPMVVGLTAVALSVTTGRWRWLARTKPLVGVWIPIAMVAPWVYAVAREVGFGEYLGIVLDETVGRSVEAKESHWGPPGYHLVVLVVFFWPGCMLTASAVGRALRRARGGRKSGQPSVELFLLCWIVPSWLVFELVSTKLPHYTLPMYPALCLLSARAAFACEGGGPGGLPGMEDWGRRIGVGLWALIGGAICVGLPIAALVVGRGEGAGLWTAAVVGAVVGLVLLSWAVVCCFQGRWVRAHVVAVGCALVAGGTTVGVVLPRLAYTWPSSRVVAALERIDPSRSRAVASIGYSQDSLVFLTDGRAERIRGEAADAWLAAHPDGLVVWSARDGDEGDEGDRGGRGGAILGVVEAFNVNGGRVERLWIVEAGVARELLDRRRLHSGL